ncbi:MAG: lipocalin family protein [Deltaproteobacteria bacterium]|jgi:hypothetical protein|nr:lipocalin family protein [Deltaproteobacteria bacterium]
MMRWLGVAVVAAGLTLGACGSSEKKDNTPSGPTWTAAPDKDALAGKWSDGTSTISFNGNGSYSWAKAIPCGSGDCKTTSTAGKWELRNGKIYLTPDGDTNEVIEFQFGNQQNTLRLNSNKSGQTWNLNRS